MGRPHGLDGSFVVEDASKNPERFAVGAVLWADGEPACVLSSKRARGRPVVRLDRDLDRGAELTVRASELPPAETDAYYAFELVGLAAEGAEVAVVEEPQLELVAEDRCERTLLRQPREGVGNQGEDVELHWHLT